MMKTIVLLAISLPLFAQSPLPPASLAHLQQAAIIRFQPPAELPEPEAAGISTNLLRTRSYYEACIERSNRKKIPNTEKRDLRIMTGPRGLFAGFLTLTFGRRFVMELSRVR